MFGRDWEPATATIVAKKYKKSGDSSGTYEYDADVAPTSGAPFRTTLGQPLFMSHVVRFTEGDVVPVLADVTHRKAKFDRSDPRVSGKGTPNAKDTFDAVLAQPPGTPPPGQP